MAKELDPETAEALELAAQELSDIPEEHKAPLRAWWKNHYLNLGHKRLARELLKKPEE